MFELVTGVDMTQHAASDVWTPPKAEPNLAGKLSSLSPESLRFIRQSLENRMSYWVHLYCLRPCIDRCHASVWLQGNHSCPVVLRGEHISCFDNLLCNHNNQKPNTWAHDITTHWESNNAAGRQTTVYILMHEFICKQSWFHRNSSDFFRIHLTFWIINRFETVVYDVLYMNYIC